MCLQNVPELNFKAEMTMRRFKKILKITGSVLGVVLLLGGLFIFHTWTFKPLTIDLFFARTFMKIGLESPEMLSSIRVL